MENWRCNKYIATQRLIRSLVFVSIFGLIAFSSVSYAIIVTIPQVSKPTKKPESVKKHEPHMQVEWQQKYPGIAGTYINLLTIGATVQQKNHSYDNGLRIMKIYKSYGDDGGEILAGVNYNKSHMCIEARCTSSEEYRDISTTGSSISCEQGEGIEVRAKINPSNLQDISFVGELKRFEKKPFDPCIQFDESNYRSFIMRHNIVENNTIDDSFVIQELLQKINRIQEEKYHEAIAKGWLIDFIPSEFCLCSYLNEIL